MPSRLPLGLVPVTPTAFMVTLKTIFCTTTVVPVPKESPPTCLNDHRPAALTPVIMMCFERVLPHYVPSSIPVTMDPLHAYRPNRSTSGTIAAAVHISRSHLENKDSSIRMLFVDYNLVILTNCERR